MTKSIIKFMILFFGLTSVSYAQEAEAEPEREIRYKERTEIDFEGVDIIGELVKPSGKLLLDRKKAKFNPLIRMRSNFDKEMKDSVDEIK
jgi:hypothetical protein